MRSLKLSGALRREAKKETHFFPVEIFMGVLIFYFSSYFSIFSLFFHCARKRQNRDLSTKLQTDASLGSEGVGTECSGMGGRMLRNAQSARIVRKTIRTSIIFLFFLVLTDLLVSLRREERDYI